MVARIAGLAFGVIAALVLVAVVFDVPRKAVQLRALQTVDDRTLVGRLIVEECFGFLSNGTKPFVLYGAQIEISELVVIKVFDHERVEGAMQSVDSRFEANWGHGTDGTRFCKVSTRHGGIDENAFAVGPMAAFIPWMTALFENPKLVPERTDVASGPSTLAWFQRGVARDDGLRVVLVVLGDPADSVSLIVAGAPPFQAGSGGEAF